MGGRGSWSAGSKGEVDVGDAKELAGNIGGVIGPVEARSNVKRMADMASLKAVGGTGDIPTAILGVQMLQMQNLEQKFEADLAYIASVFNATGGKVNRIVATSNERAYSAVVRKRVTQCQVSRAASRADAAEKGKKYQSEIAM